MAHHKLNSNYRVIKLIKSQRKHIYSLYIADENNVTLIKQNLSSSVKYFVDFVEQVSLKFGFE